MDGFPPISAMCLTYGRPELLEEAIQSFLLQDYPGVKEMLVLNDWGAQVLQCDHPEVCVVNVPRRFRTVGEKRNAAAALARHDLLFVWDDDDIYLPHRLSFSVRMLDPAKGFFKPSKAWQLDKGRVSGPKSNLFHSGGCWTRALFDRVGGYPHVGSGQDMAIELAFERVIGRGKNFNGITPADLFYLYRWGGGGSYHLSAFGRDTDGSAAGQAKVDEFLRRAVDKRLQRTGAIELRPAWRDDYPALVSAAIDRLTAASNAVEGRRVN
ncbi:MAG TPA: glycosyltransferase family A protein [Tepidisphaeraceae bacterium]|nr:glycosyltransferase family A protein [Tepidisphaeraceae bacterium]